MSHCRVNFISAAVDEVSEEGCGDLPPNVEGEFKASDEDTFVKLAGTVDVSETESVRPEMS